MWSVEFQFPLRAIASFFVQIKVSVYCPRVSKTNREPKDCFRLETKRRFARAKKSAFTVSNRTSPAHSQANIPCTLPSKHRANTAQVPILARTGSFKSPFLFFVLLRKRFAYILIDVKRPQERSEKKLIIRSIFPQAKKYRKMQAKCKLLLAFFICFCPV